MIVSRLDGPDVAWFEGRRDCRLDETTTVWPRLVRNPQEVPVDLPRGVPHLLCQVSRDFRGGIPKGFAQCRKEFGRRATTNPRGDPAFGIVIVCGSMLINKSGDFASPSVSRPCSIIASTYARTLAR